MTMLMEPLAPWVRDINRFMTGETAAQAFIPPADVLVTDEGVTVYMDVPGLSREDLELNIENDTLTVRGERPFPYRSEEEQQQRRVWRHIERRFGRFERTLRVPTGLDPDAIEASLSNGVLHVRIPKPESQKPHRVEIRSDGSEHGDPIEGTAS